MTGIVIGSVIMYTALGSLSITVCVHVFTRVRVAPGGISVHLHCVGVRPTCKSISNSVLGPTFVNYPCQMGVQGPTAQMP